MKILFAASEAKPFISAGTLGEFIEALPKALSELGNDCRIIIPLYSDIPQIYRESFTPVTDFDIEVGGETRNCKIFSSESRGVVYYFVDNENYFSRVGLYDQKDDCERYSFFCKAVLEAIRHLEFVPDIIHCNDWETGAIPVLLRTVYRTDSLYSKVKTVFTIHNVQYQGNFDMSAAEKFLGLHKSKHYIVEHGGNCNFMKGGIDQCDVATTISSTYASELLGSWHSWGMDKVLRERKYKFAGILSGIDTALYNPETDDYIPHHFSIDNLTGKAMDKSELQKEIGLDESPNTMLIGMVTRLVPYKGIELIESAADRIMKLPVQLVILGCGQVKYEDYLRRFQSRYPGRVSVITGFVPPIAHRIYAGADVLLMPSKSEPCGFSQMISLRYGTIPIVRETGGLKDSIHDFANPGGNGYTFKSFHAEDMLDAIQRAYEHYHSDCWHDAMNVAMRYDFSWNQTAAAYNQLYGAII